MSAADQRSGARGAVPIRRRISLRSPITYSPHLLVVNPASPRRHCQSWWRPRRQRPGGFSAATVGAGSAPHLGALFARLAGIDWVFVPYKGGGQALTDVVAGHAQVMFNGMLAAFADGEEQSARVLAVSSDKALADTAGRADRCRVRLSGFPHRFVQACSPPPNTAGNHHPTQRRRIRRKRSPRRRCVTLDVARHEPRPMPVAQFTDSSGGRRQVGAAGEKTGIKID